LDKKVNAIFGGGGTALQTAVRNWIPENYSGARENVGKKERKKRDSQKRRMKKHCIFS
jgi:hypothetical protein